MVWKEDIKPFGSMLPAAIAISRVPFLIFFITTLLIIIGNTKIMKQIRAKIY